MCDILRLCERLYQHLTVIENFDTMMCAGHQMNFALFERSYKSVAGVSCLIVRMFL